MTNENRFDFDSTLSNLKMVYIKNIAPEVSHDVIDKHFDKQIQELRQMGLENEEICEVLKVRFNIKSNDPEPEKTFWTYLPVVEIMYFFIGILIYYILQYSILAFIDGLFITLEYFNKDNVYTHFRIIQSAWILLIFSSLIMSIIVYRNSERLVKLIKNIKLNFFKILPNISAVLGSYFIQGNT